MDNAFKVFWRKMTENSTEIGCDKVPAALSIHAMSDWMEPGMGYHEEGDGKRIVLFVEPEVDLTEDPNGGVYEVQYVADDGEGKPVTRTKDVNGLSKYDAIVTFILEDEVGETVLVTGVEKSEPVKDRWFNVYEVVQEYGGPEEGGWYFDSGELLAAIPVLPSDQPIEERVKTWEEWAMEITGLTKEGNYSNGYRRIEVRVQTKCGCDYPDKVPHYE